jgi:DNA-directed RNA polymerase III subunit RPC2
VRVSVSRRVAVLFHGVHAYSFMGYKDYCQHCKSPINLATFKLPYAAKLLFQELQSMNVVPKLRLENL